MGMVEMEVQIVKMEGGTLVSYFLIVSLWFLLLQVIEYRYCEIHHGPNGIWIFTNCLNIQIYILKGISKNLI